MERVGHAAVYAAGGLLVSEVLFYVCLLPDVGLLQYLYVDKSLFLLHRLPDNRYLHLT